MQQKSESEDDSISEEEAIGDKNLFNPPSEDNIEDEDEYLEDSNAFENEGRNKGDTLKKKGTTDEYEDDDFEIWAL